MDRKLQFFRAKDRPDCSGQRARVSDLIVAYFLRGIRTLDAARRGPALEARRVWTARQESPAGRRAATPGTDEQAAVTLSPPAG